MYVNFYFSRFLVVAVSWLCLLACQPVQSEPTPSGDFPTQLPAVADDINSFEACVSAGFPVMESYPRQCRTDQDQLFVEDIGNELEKLDVIRIDTPRPNTRIHSPLEIRGEARGTWFFEADFPVQLLDGNGAVIATAIARAQGEWMTEDFVPFEALLEFQVTSPMRATLVLIKDNPSDLREFDDELIVPVQIGE